MLASANSEAKSLYVESSVTASLSNETSQVEKCDEEEKHVSIRYMSDDDD